MGEQTENTGVPSPAFVRHPSFTRRATEAELFPPGVPLPTLPPAEHLELAPEVERDTPQRVLLERDDERQRFLQYNYAKYRAGLSKAADAPLWASRAKHLREYLYRVNIPLIGYAYRRRAERLVGTDTDQLFSDGMIALMRCVEGFNADRGFKFSTYVVRAVFNAFSGTGQKSAKRDARMPTLSLDEAIGIPERSEYRPGEDEVAALREALGTNAAGLTENERAMIEWRFFGERVATFDECGLLLGFTKERARQTLTRALEKLRGVLACAA